ncbi:MAG: LolA family protein [Phycisphaerae bacterium]
MTRIRTLAGLLIGFVVCSGMAAADDLEKAQKDIIKNFDDVKSVSAKVVKTMKMDTNGNMMTSDGTGTYEYMRADKAGRMRLEMVEVLKINVKGSDKPMELRSGSMMLDDGEFLWKITDNMGRKNATKALRDASASPNLKEMFETIAKTADLKLLPEAKVGDEACYAIEVTPKNKTVTPASGMSPPKAKSVLYFSKKTGVMLKSAGLNEKGEEVETITYADVKLNEKIEKERLEFKAPEGVTVTDMTGGKSGPAKP